jgi:hypothetical protein
MGTGGVAGLNLKRKRAPLAIVSETLANIVLKTSLTNMEESLLSHAGLGRWRLNSPEGQPIS